MTRVSRCFPPLYLSSKYLIVLKCIFLMVSESKEEEEEEEKGQRERERERWTISHFI